MKRAITSAVIVLAKHSNFPFFKCASVKVGSGTVGLHWFLSSVLFTSASRSL